MDEVAKQIYVETEYDEVNVGAIVTPTGVICIDAPSYARDARDWAARMHRLSPYPVQNIILTDANGDRILNTRWLNAPIIMQQAAAAKLKSYEKKYPQALLESLSIRSPHRGRELSNGPVEHAKMSFSGETILLRHGLQIELLHRGGPTGGNCWVHLPEQKVVFVGDTLMLDMHPHMSARGGPEWLESLAELRPMLKTHTVVAGRGGTPTVEHIDAIVNYLTRMQQTVENHFESGKSIDTISKHSAEFMQMFPLGTRPREWVRSRIVESLGYWHDEVELEDSIDDVSNISINKNQQ